MTPFLKYSGIAAPMFRDNVDTDQIIPSREMKSVTKTGLAKGLFAGQRYLKGRTENPEFILNQPKFRNASFLLSGKNFGCGSSREHAVWALKEYGFRAIIAESFGEIFYNNCVRNGILCVQMPKGEITKLRANPQIDLEAQTVDDIPFAIPEGDRKMLMEGLDPIALTLLLERDIDAFAVRDKAARPWVY